MKFLRKPVSIPSRFIFQERANVGSETNEEFKPSDLYMIGDSLTVGMAGAQPGVRVDAVEGRSINLMPIALRGALASTPQPKVVSIMGGTNDYTNQVLIVQKYEEMVAIARSAGVKIVLATLPTVRSTSMEEANAGIRALASSDVTIVELAGEPRGGDNVHFASYGGPSQKVLEAAKSASNGEAEANTVEALLRGHIDDSVEISDEAIEGAAAKIAESIPGNLNLSSLLGTAVEEIGGIDEEGDIGVLTEKVSELVKEEEAIAELAKLSPEEAERMKGMSNVEFLEIPPAERLRFITTENITAADVVSGKVESLTYTFTFDGQYNEALWHDTTAGQSLPPEARAVTVGGTEFKREEDSLSGEFFSVTGERLTIHEGTVVAGIQIGDLAEIQTAIDTKVDAMKEASESDKLLARFALEKGIDPVFAAAAFRKKGDVIETEDLPGGEKALTVAYRAKLESFLTNVDRGKDAFRDIAQQQNEDSTEYVAEKDGRVTPEFASFYMGFDNQNEERRTEVMTNAGYSETEISGSASWLNKARERNQSSGGAVEMSELSEADLEGILEGDPASIEAEFKNLKLFPPGSPIAVKLFTYAALKANMGLSKEEVIAWGKSPDLHYILDHESKGKVGVLNYTLVEHGVSLARLKNGDQGAARSSASGLGQCLYANVDAFYPDGRAGIGDPLNEAVGMLRYIKNRYGSPAAARSVYGRTGSFVDGSTGRVRTKTFKEGY